jgi:hypothetical protein
MILFAEIRYVLLMNKGKNNGLESIDLSFYQQLSSQSYEGYNPLTSAKRFIQSGSTSLFRLASRRSRYAYLDSQHVPNVVNLAIRKNFDTESHCLV